jgi:hypothetical protein
MGDEKLRLVIRLHGRRTDYQFSRTCPCGQRGNAVVEKHIFYIQDSSARSDVLALRNNRNEEGSKSFEATY